MIFNITLLLLAFLLFHTLPKLSLSKFRNNPQSTITQQLEIPSETNQQFISRRLREIDQLRTTPVTDQQFIRNRLREIDETPLGNPAPTYSDDELIDIIRTYNRVLDRNHFRIAHRNLIYSYYNHDENNNGNY